MSVTVTGPPSLDDIGVTTVVNPHSVSRRAELINQPDFFQSASQFLIAVLSDSSRPGCEKSKTTCRRM